MWQLSDIVDVDSLPASPWYLEWLQEAKRFLIGWFCAVARSTAASVLSNVLGEALPIELSLDQGCSSLGAKLVADW